VKILTDNFKVNMSLDSIRVFRKGMFVDSILINTKYVLTAASNNPNCIFI